MNWDLELVLTKNLPSSSCEVELVAGTGHLQSRKDGFVASRPSLWIQRFLDLQLVLGCFGDSAKPSRGIFPNASSPRRLFSATSPPPPVILEVGYSNSPHHDLALGQCLQRGCSLPPHHTSVQFSGSGGLGFSLRRFQHLYTNTMVHKMESLLAS